MTDLLKQAREALAELDEAYCRAGSPLSKAERNEDRARLVAARSVVAAIDAQQAATPTAVQALTDEQIARIKARPECWEHVGQRIEFRPLPFARAVLAAAGAPPAVQAQDAKDAARYRWLRERHNVLCRMSTAKGLGLDLSTIYVRSAEQFDGVIDAAAGIGAAAQGGE